MHSQNKNSSMTGTHNHPKLNDRYICLVDADRKSGSETIQILVKCGFKIDYFVKAESALTAIKKNYYRLVILDLNVTLNSYSGDLLVNVIRKNDSFRDRIIPIIVISGKHQKENLNKAYKAGANGLLVKPLSYEKLLQRIHDLIVTSQTTSKTTLVTNQNFKLTNKSEPVDTTFNCAIEVAANDNKLMVVDNPSHKNSTLSGRPTTHSLANVSNEISKELHKLDKDILVSMLQRQILQNKQAQLLKPSLNNQVLQGEYQSRNSHAPKPVLENGTKSNDLPFYKEPETTTNSVKDIPIMHAQKKNSSKYFGIVFITLLLFATGLYYFWNPSSVHVIDTAKVEFGSLHREISITGKLISENKVDISAFVYGQITNVPVKDGDLVSTGQILAEVKNNDTVSHVKQATGKLSSAKQREILSNTTYQRLRKAYELGAVSLQELEEQEAYLGTAQTQKTIAQEEYNTAILEFEKLKITAPYSGTIISHNAQVGQQVSNNDVLFTIADLTKKVIVAYVDSADSPSIQVGQTVEMTTDAFPGKKWKEKVIRIAPAANKKDRTNTVDIFISLGPDAPTMRFGQQVDASITTFTSDKTLILPLNALIRQDNEAKVGIVADNKIKFLPVLTGEEDMTHTELKNGLTLGQEVVIPKGILKEGDKVMILSQH